MTESKLERLEHRKCFGGWYEVYRHASSACQTPMVFAVYLPELAQSKPCRWLMWLSGLTCNHENFMFKAGAQQFANRYGMILVAPDTSPRNTGIPGESASSELGEGAGFYVNATAAPWNKHYQMYDYINKELPKFIHANFPVSTDRAGIFGHSMGGHGALISYLRQDFPWKSCSAFAPVCNPPKSPWGGRALEAYLGRNLQEWNRYNASHLITQSRSRGPILVDQGMADPFLDERLRLDDLVHAAQVSGYPLDVRRREGYDHSYFYVSSFIAEHFEFHHNKID